MAKTVCLQLMLYLFICVEVMVIVGLSQLPQAVFSRAVYLHVCVFMSVSGPFKGLTAAGGWFQIQLLSRAKWRTNELLEYMLGLASISLLFFWFSSVSRFTHQSFFRNKDLISNKINIILMVDSKEQTQCHFHLSYSKCIYYTVLKKPVEIAW